jgi:hypothetical protein
LSTATLTRHPHHHKTADPIAFLRTRRGRDAYRHDLARAAGATTDQARALYELGQAHEMHHPAYKPLESRSILAVYTSVRKGSAAFIIGPDGTTAPVAEAGTKAA